MKIHKTPPEAAAEAGLSVCLFPGFIYFFFFFSRSFRTRTGGATIHSRRNIHFAVFPRHFSLYLQATRRNMPNLIGGKLNCKPLLCSETENFSNSMFSFCTLISEDEAESAVTQNFFFQPSQTIKQAAAEQTKTTFFFCSLLH